MSDIDYEHINHLLNIVEAAAKHSGKLTALSNAAMSELLAANESVRQHAISKKIEADKETAAKTAEENQRQAKVQEERLGAERKNEAQGRVPNPEVDGDQKQINEYGDGSDDDLPESGGRPIVRRNVPETPNGRRV